jgi:hypothetical protein
MRPFINSNGKRNRWLLAVTAASVAALCAVLPSAAARAQNLEAPRHRQGYYIAVGYQLGGAKIWEDNESWDVWRGGDFSIRMGELLTRHFGLGLQLLHVGSAAGQGQHATTGGLGLEAQWEVASNLAIVGEVGFDVITLSTTTKTATSSSSSRGTFSSGYALGLSYDWFPGNRLTGGWSLAPIGQVRLVPGNSTQALIGTVGVQICYWTGRPRNQLDLPPDKAFQRP